MKTMKYFCNREKFEFISLFFFCELFHVIFVIRPVFVSEYYFKSKLNNRY